jgi:hypothetical protein
MTQPVDGFGRDISCTTSMRTGQFVSGARLVAEAAYRRLTTPRGMLRGGEEEQNYGLDLTDLIGSATTKKDAASLEGRIRNELLKDERLLTIDVTVMATVEGPSTSFEILIDGMTKAGPFTLAVRVDDVSAQLLGIKAG